jgi:exodeoxyribonuclease VII large subunit
MYLDQLTGSMRNRILQLRHNTERLKRELVHLSPASKVRDRRMYTAQCLDKLEAAMENKIRAYRLQADQQERLQMRMERKLSEARSSMKLYAAQLEQRSPLAKLSGGYGFVSDIDGNAVTRADMVHAGDLVRIQLRDGRLEASVTQVDTNTTGMNMESK